MTLTLNDLDPNDYMNTRLMSNSHFIKVTLIDIQWPWYSDLSYLCSRCPTIPKEMKTGKKITRKLEGLTGSWQHDVLSVSTNIASQNEHQLKFSGVKLSMRFGDILWKVCELSKYQAYSWHIRYCVGCTTNGFGMILRCMILPNGSCEEVLEKYFIIEQLMKIKVKIKDLRLTRAGIACLLSLISDSYICLYLTEE